MPTQKLSTPFDITPEELSSYNELLDQSEAVGESPSGAIIDALVLEVNDKEVFLDVGAKDNGVCPLDEFAKPPAQSERVSVFVKISGDQIRVSHREAEQRKAWENMKAAKESQAQLTGKVLEHLPSGYQVEYQSLKLFLPMSQVDLKSAPRKKLKPGQEIDFVVLDLQERKRSAIISRKALLEERNDAFWNDLQAKYNEGDIAEGQVSKKLPFGFFVSILGVEGLLHQSDVSWKKNAPLKDRYKVGETISAKILKMDRENNRLSLGIKQLGEDPWEWAKRELTPGGTIVGKITSITDYGAFMEIKEGLEGLIHISELSWAKKKKHPKRYLQQNQEVEAKVLGIDFESKRISLGLKQLQEDPWEYVAHQIRVGDVIDGEVTSITKFGAFVKVHDEIEGLVHFSDYSWDNEPDKKMLKKGDVVQFKILDVQKEDRRISCGIKQLTPGPYDVLKQKHKKGDILPCKVTKITSFGMFADIGEGFEGLIHISRIPLKEGQKLEEAYKPGDELQAILLHIDAAERKISLSISDYEKKRERDIMNQYLKRDDGPSTIGLGEYMKK